MASVSIDCPGCGEHLDDIACACTGVGCIHEIAACLTAYIAHACAR